MAMAAPDCVRCRMRWSSKGPVSEKADDCGRINVLAPSFLRLMKIDEAEVAIGLGEFEVDVGTRSPGGSRYAW